LFDFTDEARRVIRRASFVSGDESIKLSLKQWSDAMGNVTKDEALYQEMCRVVGKVVLEMRDLGQEPKHIVIAGVLRTALANQRVKRSELTTEAMETVVKALAG
jgi:hypothetical protein